MIPVLLDKSKYMGRKFSVGYHTDKEYLVIPVASSKPYAFSLKASVLSPALEKTFTMELYPDYFPDAEAYGLFSGDDLIAFVELNHEGWNKRLRITEIYVEPASRRKGLGTILLDHAVSLARSYADRMLVLETQSCNQAAIEFYLAYGFRLSGVDLFCYSNHDVENHEVRLEMGFMLVAES